MISAQNRQLPLSGNNWGTVIASISLLLMFACSGPTKVVAPVKPEVVTSKPEVYNPKTGKFEPANAKNTHIDTVVWKESTQGPLIKDEAISEDKLNNALKKEYHVAVLLPVSEDDLGRDLASEGTEKFFHYYAGMKMGAAGWLDTSVKMNIDVIDVKAAPDAIIPILKGSTMANADLVIGPLRRDHLSETAKWSKEMNVPMVAPWNSFRTLENISENYVLLKASLPTHCEELSKFIMSKFKPSDICVVGRERSKALMAYFENELQKLSGSEKINLPQSIVKDDFKFEEGYKYMDTTKSVYIVTEFDDPNIVFNFLRHINVMRKQRAVTVIGMPSWLDYPRDFYSLFSQLNVIITTSSFADINSSEVASFKKSFFQAYQTFPMREAYEGYDAIRYLAKMLATYGRKFPIYGDISTQYGLASGFRLEKIIDASKPIDDRLLNIQCIENKALFIVQFDQFRFNKVQ